MDELQRQERERRLKETDEKAKKAYEKIKATMAKGEALEEAYVLQNQKQNQDKMTK